MLMVIDPADMVCPAVGDVMLSEAFAGRGADALVGDGEAIAEADATAAGFAAGDGLAAAEGEAAGEAASDGDGAVAGLATVGAAGAAVGALGAAGEHAAAHNKSPVLSAIRRCIGGVLSMIELRAGALVQVARHPLRQRASAGTGRPNSSSSGRAYVTLPVSTAGSPVHKAYAASAITSGASSRSSETPSVR
jgi:hypothetical protein